jgi:hypothetical protein
VDEGLDFQEAYLARRRLNLLIRHTLDLENKKRDFGLFGDVSGELCIKYDDFLRRTTQLCLALRSHGIPRIENVLTAAGGYRMLLNSSQPMTPQIIQDIGRKDARIASDRLPIIASCCEYPIRLKNQSQPKEKYSLSLSVLVMCLLKGGILYNGSKI